MSKPSKADFEKEISTVLPAMQADGGGVSFVEFTDGLLVLRMIGACGICPSLELTKEITIEPLVFNAFKDVREIQYIDEDGNLI